MARSEPLPPADKRYAWNQEAADIARKMMDKHPLKFGELVTAHMAFFSTIGGLKLRGERVAAKIATCTGEKKFLSRSNENLFEGWDYIMVVCAETWGLAPKKLKERIIFHELKHTLRLDNKTTGASVWKLVPHDFEGFYDEVDIYGEDTELRDLLMRLSQKDEPEEE